MSLKNIYNDFILSGNDGEIGPTGAQGPAGPQGPQGPAGVTNSNDIYNILNLQRGKVFSDLSGNLFSEYPATGRNVNTQSLNLTELGLLTVLHVFNPNRLYKITASWNNAINGNSSNLFTIDVNGYRESFLCQARSSRENITILYSTINLINGSAQLIGTRNPNTPADINTSSGSVSNITIIIECLCDI